MFKINLYKGKTEYVQVNFIKGNIGVNLQLLLYTGDSVFQPSLETEMVQLLASNFGVPPFVYPSPDITGVSFAIGSHVRLFTDSGAGPTKLSLNFVGK